MLKPCKLYHDTSENHSSYNNLNVFKTFITSKLLMETQINAARHIVLNREYLLEAFYFINVSNGKD